MSKKNKKTNPRNSVTISFSDEVFAKIKALAEAEKRTLAALLRLKVEASL